MTQAEQVLQATQEGIPLPTIPGTDVFEHGDGMIEFHFPDGSLLLGWGETELWIPGANGVAALQ